MIKKTGKYRYTNLVYDKIKILKQKKKQNIGVNPSARVLSVFSAAVENLNLGIRASDSVENDLSILEYKVKPRDSWLR